MDQAANRVPMQDKQQQDKSEAGPNGACCWPVGHRHSSALNYSCISRIPSLPGSVWLCVLTLRSVPLFRHTPAPLPLLPAPCIYGQWSRCHISHVYTPPASDPCPS